MCGEQGCEESCRFLGYDEKNGYKATTGVTLQWSSECSVDGCLTDWIVTVIGVMQGCILSPLLFRISLPTTPCPKKTKHICFCHNFVKFPPILIIFGRKMGNDPNICEVHSLSTSPNLRHHLTVLNANVPNCYITLNVVICNKLLKT